MRDTARRGCAGTMACLPRGPMRTGYARFEFFRDPLRIIRGVGPLCFLAALAAGHVWQGADFDRQHSIDKIALPQPADHERPEPVAHSQ